MNDKVDPPKCERIAKVMARAGLCSRREAERWIADGRVSVDKKILTTPACVVTAKSIILVDGKPLPEVEVTRLWRYHKPTGQMTSHNDPEGRETVFKNLPDTLPRVISVGRLDYNSEGLLLLTNDGELARKLELPSTGWARRYRVRVHGHVNEERLLKLKDGVTVEGITYGSIVARLDRQQGDNAWMTVSIHEGKNREIRKIMEHLNLTVNRLIRISYGPFQLGNLAERAVEEIKGRTLREQLGEVTPQAQKKPQQGKKPPRGKKPERPVKKRPKR
ncbi:MAG: pseudouridine synthase [Rhodospirillales bacterium]